MPGPIPRQEYTKVWQKISEMSNYMDPIVVKNVYYGMCRLIIKELRETGKCWMPDLGDFRTIVRSPRRISIGSKGMNVEMGAIKVVRFTAAPKMRGYFKKLSEGEEDYDDGRANEEDNDFKHLTI